MHGPSHLLAALHFQVYFPGRFGLHGRLFLDSLVNGVCKLAKLEDVGAPHLLDALLVVSLLVVAEVVVDSARHADTTARTANRLVEDVVVAEMLASSDLREDFCAVTSPTGC